MNACLLMVYRQVMEELKASGNSGKPSFVSTNDIICAMVWQVQLQDGKEDHSHASVTCFFWPL
jgi:hypothetical protein